MHPVINIEHLKKYKLSPEEFPERTTLPPTRDFLPSEEYEVEAILGHKLAGNTSVTHLEQAISLETYKDISRLIGSSAIFFLPLEGYILLHWIGNI